MRLTFIKDGLSYSNRLCAPILVMGSLLLGFVSAATTPAKQESDYVLGPRDVITVRVPNLDEFTPLNLGPIPIDSQGDIHLPLIGRIHASGLSSQELEVSIAESLTKLVDQPDVSVILTEAKSHPISVMGAVKTPGVYQVNGKQTLFEVLSLAGGLAPEAGNAVKISRRVTIGPLPLANARLDPSGMFYIGELNLRSVMDAKSPAENIQVVSEDVITVPKADMVYIVGAVTRPGGFVLSEKEQISVLQAISLAEGLTRVAAGKKARILRKSPVSTSRTETLIDVDRILAGQAGDVPLYANDILFIPNSAAKNASIRAMEAGIQLATGMITYGRIP